VPARDPARSAVDRVAEEVRGFRARRGWTQAQLADRAGVSATLIYELERGRANPTLGTLVKIAAALGVEAVELFGTGSSTT